MGAPSLNVKSAFQVSAVPGSVKMVVKVLVTNTSGPTRDGVPVNDVIVGATFVTTTLVVYSVKPPSLSIIRARTVYVPLSG